MEIIVKVCQLILSLSILVFVHELGHYLFARLFGIRVDKFYLFFDAGGFSIFKFKLGETTFGMGWVPFGGYCKIAGMVDESLDRDALRKEPQPWEFRSKPAWQRLLVMVGGVMMNVVCACVIYVGMSWHWGESYIDNRDLAWGWYFNDLAEQIGFVDGDRIVRLDDREVEGSFGRVYSDMLIGGVRRVEVVRDSAVVNVVIPQDAVARMLVSEDFMTPRVPFQADSLVMAGASPMEFLAEYQAAIAQYLPVRRVNYGFWGGISAGFRKTGDEIAGYWDQLKLIFSPRTEAYKQVGSLISIGNIFPGEWNWFLFWRITAFLSIILAVMNILPIPCFCCGRWLLGANLPTVC